MNPGKVSTAASLYHINELELMQLEGWETNEDEFWFRCVPPAFPFRAQGWKIHLSTSLFAAQEVLDTAVRILSEAKTAFKFAKSPDQLRALLSHRFDRGGGGKFITIYPRDDSDFISLVEKLTMATKGFAGPTIMSDRRISESSIVHYRYGAISSGIQRLRDEGYFEVPLINPKGEFEEDARNPWFSPPEWSDYKAIEEQLSDIIDTSDETASDSPSNSDEILLADRFQVIEAVRHSNRGGVYRAVDRLTNQTVFLKEARPFIGPEDDGTDMTDRLRHEFHVLREFIDKPVSLPEPLLLFEEGGHLFLAETEVAGETLRDWRQKMQGLSEREMETRDAVASKLIDQLESLVMQVHEAGYVLRDLTPGNLMVQDDSLSMIDPEYFAKNGQLVPPAFTYGYAPLSVIRERNIAPAAGDDYNLGMCIAFIASGIEPPIILAETTEDEAERTVGDWLDIVFTKSPLARKQELRIRQLTGQPASAPVATVGGDSITEADRSQAPVISTAIHEVLQFLSDVDWTKAGETGFSPWRVDDSGTTFGDHASVQTGFSGAVQLLSDAMETPLYRPLYESTLRHSAMWLARAVSRPGERNLPGLYFGRSGAAWALRSASIALDDDYLANISRRLLTSMPIAWDNPDMTHGISGLGTAHLRELRIRQDPLLERRARAIANGVMARVEESAEGAFWPIRSKLPDAETDQAHLGFAHGVAGMGTFLLDAAEYFGDESYLHMAMEAGRTLEARAIHRADGAVDWPIGVVDRAEDTRVVRWWCSGSGGIGAFAVRLAAVTGRDTMFQLARGAALACQAEDMQLMPGHCHGISGNAQLFLDLRTLDDRFDVTHAAMDSAKAMLNRRVIHRGYQLFSNDVGNRVSVSYGQGVSGPASYLLRLLYDTDRPFTWMPDKTDTRS